MQYMYVFLHSDQEKCIIMIMIGNSNLFVRVLSLWPFVTLPRVFITFRYCSR